MGVGTVDRPRERTQRPQEPADTGVKNGERKRNRARTVAGLVSGGLRGRLTRFQNVVTREQEARNVFVVALFPPFRSPSLFVPILDPQEFLVSSRQNFS